LKPGSQKNKKQDEGMSLLADLPHGGLLAHMADKAVRAASPRQHIQTRDAEHVVVRTDKTNILIRRDAVARLQALL
jgi:hypothetical protein